MRTRYVEKRNKSTEKNCAPSWLYLQNYTGLHSQQNIKRVAIVEFTGWFVSRKFTKNFWCLIPF